MHTADEDPKERTTDPADSRRLVAEIAELAGGLAHELRNPLSTMMIHLTLLAEDLGDERSHFEDIRRRARLKVEILRREAGRLQNLFDEFLSLTSPCQLQRVPTDLKSIVARLVEFFEPLANSHGVALRVSAPEHPLICPADESLISRALLNLVINAQEAMPHGGTIQLEARREGDRGVIAVSDTGVGIAAADRDMVMRPFYSTKGTGTGLGLSLAQRIVHEHGGTLVFTSEVGRGTTFTLRLPAEPDADGGRRNG